MSLQEESERLARSWMRHDAGMLRDYLVSSVEDPRLNLQSIFSRHFLLQAVTGEAFAALMEQESRFSAVMNWVLNQCGRGGNTLEDEALLLALKRGVDNFEGVEIPWFARQAYRGLPLTLGRLTIPNYLERFLREPQNREANLSLFSELWREVLAGFPKANAESGKPKVFEPACGSANDYRQLAACGLSDWFDYTGIDICAKNVDNARALFPGVRFELGNAFEIAAADQAFDLCFVHDLFEHLSPDGFATAVREICRVTRGGICVGFFGMDEILEHVVRPVEEYHWNTLSLERTRELFARHGFVAQTIHVATFLRERFGCPCTHNPTAYTFILRPIKPSAPSTTSQL